AFVVEVVSIRAVNKKTEADFVAEVARIKAAVAAVPGVTKVEAASESVGNYGLRRYVTVTVSSIDTAGLAAIQAAPLPYEGRINLDAAAPKIDEASKSSTDKTGAGLGDMLKRLWNVIRSIFGKGVRAAENPELLLEQYKEDIRDKAPKMNQAVVQSEK